MFFRTLNVNKKNIVKSFLKFSKKVKIGVNVGFSIQRNPVIMTRFLTEKLRFGVFSYFLRNFDFSIKNFFWQNSTQFVHNRFACPSLSLSAKKFVLNINIQSMRENS